MTGSAEPADLSQVTRWLRSDPGFLAGWLGGSPVAERALARRLGLDRAALDRLLLCRSPRPQDFAADVVAIGHALAADPDELAAGLREAAFLAAMDIAAAERQAGDRPAGLLLAARDHAVEATPQPPAGVERLRELAAATWAAVPAASRGQRDVAAAIAWSSPLAVVSLPGLSTAAVREWLAGHGVALPGPAGEARPLRGLLVAWRGVGAVFVDAGLDPAERRFTLAHEHGHFLLDYLAPRRRVRREVPSLLEVMDGRREPTEQDRARALLARVPLGIHTHLLARDPYGGAPAEVAEREDDASRYALELLSPWPSLLDLLRSVAASGQGYDDALGAAATAVERHFGLPPAQARARARAGLDGIGRRRRFFER